MPFDQYGSNSMAAQAISDMNNLPFLQSSSNNEFPFPVNAGNLFRGRFQSGDGNVQGPYISQFMVQPTMMGGLAITGQIQTFQPNQAFMTTPAAFLNIANGGASQGTLQMDPTPRFIRNGRDLAAYTHVDTLFQEYLVAIFLLSQIGTPANPGQPYSGSQTQKALARWADRTRPVPWRKWQRGRLKPHGSTSGS